MMPDLIVGPDDTDYFLLVFLSEMIARYTNAHCHFDLQGIPEAERLAEIETLKSWFEELSH